MSEPHPDTHRVTFDRREDGTTAVSLVQVPGTVAHQAAPELDEPRPSARITVAEKRRRETQRVRDSARTNARKNRRARRGHTKGRR